MEARLIYNTNAGNINGVTPDEIKEALVGIGYHPIYEATSKEEDLDSILANVKGPVVVAGGDGTLRAVATRLIGKNVPLSLIPLGTANNVANTLGIKASPVEIVKGLDNPQKRAFDVGYVRGPWGEDYFLEGAGWGLFADVLADYDPEQGKNIIRSLTSTVKVLTTYETYGCQMVLDDKDISGDYILVEILNTVAVGPRLKLAPEADPSDGLLDVVRVQQNGNEDFMDYALSLLSEDVDQLSDVQLLRGRKLEISWSGFNIHLDAETRPKRSRRPKDQEPAEGARPNFAGPSDSSTVTIEVLPHALEFWLPPTVD